MRFAFYIVLSLFAAFPLRAAEYTFQGYVKEAVSWTRGEDKRATVFLEISGSDPMLAELRIIFTPQDGTVESITWMGKNASDLTKSEKKIPALAGAVKDRRFKIIFSGPRFDSDDQDKLVIIGFQWLQEEKKKPNQSSEPTPPPVTPRADARVAPAGSVAHL